MEWDCSDKEIARMFNTWGHGMSGMSHRQARCLLCEQFLGRSGQSLARMDVNEM